MSFPWYAILLFGLFMGWPYELAAGLLLGGLALACNGRTRAWLLGVGGTLLVIGTVCGLVFVDMRAHEAAQEADSAIENARLSETLLAPRRVLADTLPAGTVVQWTDEARVQFSSLELKGPARIFGLLLTGSVEDDFQLTRWEGELAEDQSVGGWPCRKGPVSLSYLFQLEECVLAEDHAAFGVVYPAGSQLKFQPDYDTHNFVLPADRTMAFPLLGVTLPASSEVKIMYGQVHEVAMPAGQSVRVHGLPMANVFQLTSEEEKEGQGATGGARTEVSGILPAELVCAGRRFPVDSPVTYNLRTGKATAQLRQEDGPDLPPVDISSCVRR